MHLRFLYLFSTSACYFSMSVPITSEFLCVNFHKSCRKFSPTSYLSICSGSHFAWAEFVCVALVYSFESDLYILFLNLRCAVFASHVFVYDRSLPRVDTPFRAAPFPNTRTTRPREPPYTIAGAARGSPANRFCTMM